MTAHVATSGRRREYEKQSRTRVTIQPSVTGEAYDTKMCTLLAGGDPPGVMRVNDDFVRGFSDQDVLVDLTPYTRRDKLDTGQFAREAHEFPKQADGSHTAWVLGYQPRLVFYNVDMFKEAGVPLPPTTWTSDGWTWDDFAEAAKKLTIPGQRYGDPREVEAMQWATDPTRKVRVQPPWSQLRQERVQNQMFAQGRLAMLFTSFGTVRYLRQTVREFTWDIAPPPGGVDQKTESSVVVFTVAKSAKNPTRRGSC
jgi:multiple sugar transport system substrate-binding protein